MQVCITSWNTQGDGINKISQSISSFMNSKLNNIFLIQEAGKVEYPGVLCNVNFGKQNFQGLFCEQNDAINKRCTTGILVKDSIKAKFFCYDGMGERPIVCAVIQYTAPKYGEARECIIATVHLTANSQKSVGELIDMNIAFREQFPDSDWLIMGDMNCPPDEINVSETLVPINIVPPDSPTHQSGKIFDYAIVSDTLKGKVGLFVGGVNDPSFVPIDSDHFPVSCILDL